MKNHRLGRWVPFVFGYTGKIGEGEENLSEDRFSSPSPIPTPSTPKTFDLIESLLSVFSVD